MNPIYLLALAGTLMASGDMALAVWARGGQVHLIAIGLLLNMLGIVAYAHTLGAQNIGIATAALLGLNILAVAAFGFLFFGQSLSMAQAAGMTALAASIIFIEVMA